MSCWVLFISQFAFYRLKSPTAFPPFPRTRRTCSNAHSLRRSDIPIFLSYLSSGFLLWSSPPCFEIATGSPAPFSLTSQLSAYRINSSINESHEIIGHSIEPTLCLLKVVVHCLNLSSVPVKINHQTFLKL